MESTSSTNTLSHRWNELHAQRQPILSKLQEYSHWTLPWMFPVTDKTSTTAHIELPQPAGSIGARCVNHLANKIVSTLFVPFRPFFKIELTKEERQAVTSSLGLTEMQFEAMLADVENKCMSIIDLAKHRTEAVTAVKQLIIQGNSLLKYDGNTVQVYNLLDYVVKRDINGKVKEFLIQETINTEQLPSEVTTVLEAKSLKVRDKHCSIQLYTKVKLETESTEEGSKSVWKVTQEVKNVGVNLVAGLNPQYTQDDLPWIFLTWNLVRGEDYGRGLVEDFSYAFHAHEVLSSSSMRQFAIVSDTKFFVNPGAFANPRDVDKIVQSPPGSYHTLQRDSIWVPQYPVNDIAVMENKVDKIERELAQAFLLNSAAVRDAERVTAEEIRMQVQELETSYGGLYSRLATEWQVPLATLLLNVVDSSIPKLPNVTIKIVTGLESMSRLGELENVRVLLTDMAAIAQMPEPLLTRLKSSELWAYMGILRGIDTSKFVKSEEEFQQEMQAAQQAQMQQQQQLMQAQAQTTAAASITQGE